MHTGWPFGCFCFLLFTLNYVEQTKGDRKIICQGSKAQIKCGKGSTVVVTSATYGRRDLWTCRKNSIISTSNCGTINNVLNQVKSKCDKKHQCKLNASNNVFGHPCPGTSVYLDVTFSCIKGCKKQQFQCANGQCIRKKQVCNGKKNCGDGSDEKDCKVKFKCKPNQFECKKDNKCINKKRVCDGKPECSDRSDERRCKKCKPNQFKCKTSNKCIQKKRVCDNRKDCDDGSDEENCKCNSNEFQCETSRKCIPKYLVCNNRKDCTDGSDEIKCKCNSNEFQCETSKKCIPKHLVCNRRYDCGDGSDERNCKCNSNEFQCETSRACIPNRLVCDNRKNCKDGSDEIKCKCNSNQFQCETSKKCIPKHLVCNRRYDCRDGSDERNCKCNSNQFQCETSKKCIPKYRVCNNRNDCRDGSDERNCKCNSNEFRCETNKKCIPNRLVCDNRKDCKDGSDELKCSCNSNQFQCKTSKKCISNYLVCNRRYDCKDGSDEHNCKCNSNEFRCETSKKCIPNRLVCDRRKDCNDGSDELKCDCTSNEFKCVRSKKCIQSVLVCDGKNDCEDGSDEKDCGTRGTSQCGIPKISPALCRIRIVGGCAVIPHSWPWALQLVFDKYDNGTFRHECGAALLSPMFALTASHCFLGSRNPDKWRAMAGRHKKFGTDVKNVAQIKQISKIVSFPRSSINILDKDVTIIKFTTPVAINDYVSPVCLPTREPNEKDNCFVVGWGETQGTGSDDILKQTLMPIVEKNTCNQTEEFKGEITPYMICGGWEKGKNDACQGDSGGPLMCKIGGAYYLQGLVSWGVDCAAPKLPGVYADVFKFVDWIQQQMKTL